MVEAGMALEAHCKTTGSDCGPSDTMAHYCCCCVCCWLIAGKADDAQLCARQLDECLIDRTEALCGIKLFKSSTFVLLHAASVQVEHVSQYLAQLHAQLVSHGTTCMINAVRCVLNSSGMLRLLQF
jgi:hypothetical protein